jgi:cytochrome c biogenesis protein CcmG/thiol:disulfide interchange protein DsbE
MNFSIRMLPFLTLLLLCVVLGVTLSSRPTVTSKIIGQKPDDFLLPLLNHETPVSFSAQINEKPTIVNIFASWCESCRVEHPTLLQLARTQEANIMGIAWRDTPEKIKAWLAAHGNPYHRVLVDGRGISTVPLALTGVPETFVFNKDGVIVYNNKSALTEEELRDVVIPLIKKLQYAP